MSDDTSCAAMKLNELAQKRANERARKTWDGIKCAIHTILRIFYSFLNRHIYKKFTMIPIFFKFVFFGCSSKAAPAGGLTNNVLFSHHRIMLI